MSVFGRRDGSHRRIVPRLLRQSPQPVANLTELMGFRSPNLHDSSVPPRIAERVADISGGRAAAEAQLDADRWLDEGGSLPPEAIAEAVALPRPTPGA